MSKLCLCMGYFDSVHIGHRELIRLGSQYAFANGMTSSVYTFSEDETGSFDSLYSFDSRKILLKNAGADLIMSDIFSEKLKNTCGKQFLDDLTARCDVGAFFCGYDYSFGRNAECDAAFLCDYAARMGAYCFVMPPVLCDGQRVSTTHIKELLGRGEVERANRLLGEPFFMKGKVVLGRGVGRKFGYPTANLDYIGFLPKEGVYKTVVTADGKEYTAVTNIGGKPTFGISSTTVESMLVDFDGDLYGKEIEIRFIKYIRSVFKFESGEELKAQIDKDIREALC